MARELTPEAASRVILALARRQHGVVAVPQLLAAGVTWEHMRTRERAGWVRRVHRGVYCVEGGTHTQRSLWTAAVLACGDAAVLSHRDAGALWRIVPASREPGRPIDVTVPRRRRPRRPGILVHRARLGAADVTTHHGIPVTTPGRTILDLATLLPRRRLERAIDEAEYLRLCGQDELAAILTRHRGRCGTALLARVLETHAAGTTRTRTELEEMFLALCRERGLPQPLVNAPLLGLTVDFFWPPAVVVEVDGAASHATRRGFQDDRDRDSLLAAHGYTVVRFTWWDVERRPAVVADRVRRVLRPR